MLWNLILARSFLIDIYRVCIIIFVAAENENFSTIYYVVSSYYYIKMQVQFLSNG